MDASAQYPELERLLTHTDWLRSLARRLVSDPAAADDLVQETWLAAMKSPPDPDRPVRPWLAGVIRRLARMRARGEGRRSYRQRVAARKDGLPSTAELVEGVDTQRRLAEVVVDLPEPFRTTVLLRYYEGLSSAEIARRQDVPAGTVRWRLKRGMDELRQQLDSHWGERSSWMPAMLAFANGGTRGSLVAAGSVSAGLGYGPWFLAAMAAVLLSIPMLRAAKLVFGAEPEAVSLTGLTPETLVDGDDRALFEVEDQPSRVERVVAGTGAEWPARPLRVRDAGGAPVVGATIGFLGDDGHVEWGETDADGAVELHPSVGVGELYVARPGSFIHRTPFAFEEADGEHSLPPGARVTGRLVAVGGEALEGLEVQLDSDRHLWAGDEIPSAVAAVIGNGRRASMILGERGYFEFRDLPLGWSGELWLPESLALAGLTRRSLEGKRQHFSGAQAGLLIEVDHLQRVEGRLLAVDGVPSAGALVQVWLDDSPAALEARTDGEGRFAVQLPGSPRQGLRLQALSATEDQRLELKREPDHPLALGNLHLERAAGLTILAVDETGTPVPGAVARVIGSRSRTEPAGEQGLLSLVLEDEADQRVRVDAPGYLGCMLEANAGSRMEAQLREANRLMLSIVDAQGAAVSGLRVRLTADQRAFIDGHSLAGQPLDHELGPWRVERSSDRQATFLTGPAGRLEWIGLVPGVELQLELSDSAGAIVHTQTLEAPAAGERRAERLRVPTGGRSLEVIVRDEAGAMLVASTVSLGDGEGWGPSRRTGLHGRVEFAAVTGERVDVRVDKRGFAPIVLRDLLVPGPGQALEVEANPGLRVAFDVVDESGTPLHGARIVARFEGGGSITAEPVAAVDQVLTGLPTESPKVTVELGGVVYDRVLDASSGSTTIVLPQHGEVEVAWSTAGEQRRLVASPVAVEAGPEEPLTIHLSAPVGSGVERITLRPGSWRLRLQARSGAGAWRWAGEGVEVEVVPGATPPVQLTGI